MKRRKNPDEYIHWNEYLDKLHSQYMEPSDSYQHTASLLNDSRYGLGDDDITPMGTLKDGDRSIYTGTDVAWDGIAGRMIKIPAEYAESIEGNIFYPDKLLRVEQLVNRARDTGKYALFDAPLVAPFLITLGRIAESQQGWEHDGGYGRAYSTGDEELDKFLKDPEEWGDDEMYNADIFDNAVFDTMNLKSFPGAWKDKWELLHYIYKRWNAWQLDELEVSPIEHGFYEAYEDDLQIYEPIGDALEMAMTSGTGDVGQLAYQIRDGNHRAFGSLATGEPYIWGIVTDNQMQEIQDAVLDNEGNLLGFTGRHSNEEVTPWRQERYKALHYWMDRWKGVKRK